MEKKIVSWIIEVEWEDGVKQKLNNIPDYVALEVDSY
jgi:hypothetical protein